MAFIVPAVLVGLALAVMAIVSVMANRKRRIAAATPAVNMQRILIHAINDDRCTGCDACVAVCPTNVLDLVSNKSRVLRFQDCIQCEACMWACPTEALVMHPEGTQPPPVRVPDIDQVFQTRIPGQYLIGEVAGKPLVKNAANLGRAVVEHMLSTGIRKTPGGDDHADVIIVGSGPGGLSAALTCQQRGLSYLVIEKEAIISSTVSRYPKGKLVMAEPYDIPNLSLLPVFDSTKEEIVALWGDLIKKVGVRIKMNETVQTVQRQHDGSFLVISNGGQYRSQRVVLATGTRGKPRTLGAPGEAQAKVHSLLEDPDDFKHQAVCVIGGGDSALEAAMALAEAQAKVIMSYRGRSFHRAAGKNRQKIDAMAKQGRIKIKFQSEIVEFGTDTVTLQMADGTQKRYPNQAAFVLIGADPPIKWLGSLGIHYVERPHMAPMPASHDLVRQFVPNASECPENASDAAAQVAGRAVQPPQPAGKKEKVGAGRRFIRSASAILHIGEEKTGGPMPLSEFAKRGGGRHGSRHGSRHDGGRARDELDAGERTRILRMLRDEGGRRADEDSKLHYLDENGVPLDGSPYATPPANHAAYDQAPPQPASFDQAAYDDALYGPGPSAPPVAADPSPKQAVIVGLAQATANASPSRRSPRARPLGIHEENTQHLSQDDAQALLRQATQNDEDDTQDTPFPEEATNLVDFDPAAMMALHEQQMRNAQPGPAPLPPPSKQPLIPPPPRIAGQRGMHEEATRNIDVDSLVVPDISEDPTNDDYTPSPEFMTPSPEFTPTPQRHPPLYEEPTRVVGHTNEPAPRSLSEVDWDLD